MFTVTGRLKGGEPYHVIVDRDSEQPNWGIVRGSSAACALLASLHGEQVEGSPTGPYWKLDDSSPEAIFAALAQHTEILSTTGEVPNIAGDVPLGARA